MVSQKLDAVLERIARVEALAPFDPLVPLDREAGRGQSARELVEIVEASDAEARVGSSRGGVGSVGAEVELLRSHTKPKTVAFTQAVGATHLVEPEELAVKPARLVLYALRNRQKGVIERDDRAAQRRYCSSCQEGTGANSRRARPPRGSR